MNVSITNGMLHSQNFVQDPFTQELLCPQKGYLMPGPRSLSAKFSMSSMSILQVGNLDLPIRGHAGLQLEGRLEGLVKLVPAERRLALVTRLMRHSQPTPQGRDCMRMDRATFLLRQSQHMA